MENDNYIIPDGEYSKKGYLKENYKVFKINDKTNTKFDFHYHEFDKLVFFISGNASYIIEGKEYILEPYDILLVRHGDIHKPVINTNENYNRIIIWINKNYLNREYDLSRCFDIARKKHFNLVRADYNERERIFSLANELANYTNGKYADELYKDALFTQLIILVNRTKSDENNIEYKSDRQIDKVIEYINENLLSNLTVEKIADEFFISRYHLMHKFKAATGKTIYSYIQTKRLLNASVMLNKGESAKSVCFHSGYNDYSVFHRAFKKEFGVAPKDYTNYK